MSVKIFGKSRLSVFFNKNDFAEFPLSFEKFFILLHRRALTRVAPALLKGCSKDPPISLALLGVERGKTESFLFV